jgi:hypothetical protein
MWEAIDECHIEKGREIMPPALSGFEPRIAGADAVEPATSFAANNNPLTDMARCGGCCLQHTSIDIATHSQTQ